MPFQTPDIRVFINGNMINSPIVFTGTSTTNASGVARLYLTNDRTAGGEPIFRNVHTWATDIETSTPVNNRAMVQGANYIDVTVSGFQFVSISVLGIPVIGSVTSVPIAGATVRFIVLGD